MSTNNPYSIAIYNCFMECRYFPLAANTCIFNINLIILFNVQFTYIQKDRSAFYANAI